jgi:hypothetical protein
MFYGCYSLQTIPLLNTSAGTTFTYMFFNCFSLQSIPLLNTALGTTFGSMLSGCYSLKKCILQGAKKNSSINNSILGATELNNLFTALGTSTPAGQSITITGNPGAATCTRSIATAKGWTVIG